MNSKQVCQLMVERQLLSPSQFEATLNDLVNQNKTIEQALVENGVIDLRIYYQVIADAAGTYFIDLSRQEIRSSILDLLPADLARHYRVVPIECADGKLHVATSDPFDLRISEDLRFATGLDIQLVLAPTDQIERVIAEHYDINQDRPEQDAQVIESEANAAPIVQHVDLILSEAIKRKASDIHFEPFEDQFRIRYRVDGTLCEVESPPRHLSPSIISRVKVMGNLDIAERRLPQDGRIQTMIDGRTIDLRVSTLPTQGGESVVLRVLDRSAVSLDLESIGLPEEIYQLVLQIIQLPNGMFIVTGPTGSGKTTTLYSCLRKINTIDSKLLTAEEPVEYDLEGVVQIPVSEGIGLTFARALRAFLRQDPDRIMVGETRDLETAQIAIQAALTGHFVLTTLHTNDAPGTVTRLIDMGVEPFLISSTLEAVLAQRLLRTICSTCREQRDPNPVILEQLGLSTDEIATHAFYHGKGCNACNGTGYKGRKGIFELLRINEAIRELINQRAPTVTLKKRAIEQGMITMRQTGLRAVFEGETTLEELLKYT